MHINDFAHDPVTNSFNIRSPCEGRAGVGIYDSALLPLLIHLYQLHRTRNEYISMKIEYQV